MYAACANAQVSHVVKIHVARVNTALWAFPAKPRVTRDETRHLYLLSRAITLASMSVSNSIHSTRHV